MDALSGLYGLTGTSDPASLAVSVLIALVLAGGLASLVLEVGRIAREYSGKPDVSYGLPPTALPPIPQRKTVKPADAPKEKPVEKALPKAPEKPAVPAVEVVKSTLKESVEALEKKYRLNAITLATVDGLVIASTIKEPEEEAAVWSGKFNELNKQKPGNYHSVADKGVYLYMAESTGNKVIGVARRSSALEQAEVTSLQDDTRMIIDKFAPAVKKS